MVSSPEECRLSLRSSILNRSWAERFETLPKLEHTSEKDELWL